MGFKSHFPTLCLGAALLTAPTESRDAQNELESTSSSNIMGANAAITQERELKTIPSLDFSDSQ